MTPRGAALTGTWLWSCMRKGYPNMFCTFLWSWIQFAAQICRIWTFYWEISVKCYMNTLMLLILNLQCGVINKQQYVRWRERGLAFEMREGVYQITNPSLLSSRVFSKVRAWLFSVIINNASIRSYWKCVCVCEQKGEKVAVMGYWGDIVSSPYLSFGIESDDKSLLKTQNGQHMKVKQCHFFLSI